PRHARAQRTADAVSPRLQRAALRSGVARQILPRDPGPRPEVRRRRRLEISRESRTARGDRCSLVRKPEIRNQKPEMVSALSFWFLVSAFWFWLAAARRWPTSPATIRSSRATSL